MQRPRRWLVKQASNNNRGIGYFSIANIAKPWMLIHINPVNNNIGVKNKYSSEIFNPTDAMIRYKKTVDRTSPFFHYKSLILINT